MIDKKYKAINYKCSTEYLATKISAETYIKDFESGNIQHTDEVVFLFLQNTIVKS